MSKRGQGEGSIYQDSEGRWRASLSHGWKLNENGKAVPMRKLFSGATRDEVAKKLTKSLRDLQQGIPPAPERQTLGEFLTHWLEHTAKANVRPSTFQSYTWLIEKHLVPGLGRIPLAKLSPQQVQKFLNEQLQSGRLPERPRRKKRPEGAPPPPPGLTPRTVQHAHATLRAALEQALRWGLVARNVAKLVDSPRVRRPEVQPFTPEEAKQFLSSITEDRLEALYTAATAVGLRLGEALGLQWDDIDFGAGTLTVRRALQRVNGKLREVETKTQKSRRTLNLPQVAISALLRHRAKQEQERQFAGERWRETAYLFTTTVGTALDGSTVTHRFQAALKRAGLRRMRFHDLRHSAASLLLAQGVHPKVVQEIGGWSNIQIVLNTYSHLIPALKSEAAAKMDEILAPKPVASSVASKTDFDTVN